MTDKLHVIDGAMRAFPNVLIPDHKAIRAAMPKARRFILDDAGSVELGRILGAAEDLILDNHQFAIPPFETTYLELNTRLLYLHAGKRTMVHKDYKRFSSDLVPSPTIENDDPFQDDRVGYLIDRGRMWVFTRTRKGDYGIGPWCFHDSLGHADDVKWPAHLHPQAAAVPPHWGMLAIMLGTGVHSLPGNGTAEELRARFSVHKAIPDVSYERWSTWVSATGDVRNMLALLLIMNTPKRVELIAQQPKPGIVKGRRVVYAAHHVIKLQLGKAVDNPRRLFKHWADRAPPRAHEVRGHFVHYHLRDGCIHDWSTLPESREDDGAPRWTCLRCGGKRVWRKKHDRGDASRGWVTKHYEVTDVVD